MALDLASVPLEDAFHDEKALKRYRDGMRRLWHSLCLTKTHLYLLDRILNFPFRELHIPASDLDFWHLITRSLLLNCVVQFRSTLLDERRHSITIPKLAKEIEESLVKPHLREDFNERFKAAWSALEEGDVLSRLDKLRHALVHLKDTRDKRSHKVEIRYQELQELSHSVTCIWKSLQFDYDWVLDAGDYSETVRSPAGTDQRTDIERVLDLVALDSHLVNQVERNPGTWARTAPRLPSNERKLVSKYRRMADLSPAPFDSGSLCPSCGAPLKLIGDRHKFLTCMEKECGWPRCDSHSA